MPELIQLFRLFVGTPSDVVAEPEIIARQAAAWNLDHGSVQRARVESTHWRTHSHPEAGGRPQAILNRQLVDKSDFVVGIFRARFGSPTGVAGSGTEEEIRRGIRQGKPVMVYFGSLPTPKRGREQHELARVEAFKRKLGRQAIYHTYTDLGDFEKAFRHHLAATMNGLLAKHPHPVN